MTTTRPPVIRASSSASSVSRPSPCGVAPAATADVLYVFGENTAQRYVRAAEIR